MVQSLVGQRHQGADHCKVHVLHVVDALEAGGAEQLLLTVVKNINGDRYKIIVCCLSEFGPLADEVAKAGADVLQLHHARKSNDAGVVRELMCVIRERQISIVHTHTFSSNFYGRVVAVLGRVPVIVNTQHNVYRHRTTKQVVSDFVMARFTDGMIANSEAVKRFTARQLMIPIERFRVIYNCIDTSVFEERKSREEVLASLGIPSDAFVISVVAKLWKQKGHRYLLEAMRGISTEMPAARLLIVGTGPLDLELRTLAASLGVAESVHFLGARRDVPDLLGASDLLVLPSLWEGFGIALCEAMYSELPVVATNVDGIPEVVSNGDTGLLVTPRDPVALERAILTLACNEEVRRRMGRRGKERVLANFSPKRHVTQLEEFYEDLLLKKGIRWTDS